MRGHVVLNLVSIYRAILRSPRMFPQSVYTERFYDTVTRASRALKRSGEDMCNYGEDRHERATRKALKDLEELKRAGLIAYYFHQTDPRGVSLYISFDQELTETNYTGGVAII